jgi:hypothetical protein
VRSRAQVLETPECFAQFMGKNSAKYCATGGWGFGHLNATEGKSGDEAFMNLLPLPCEGRKERLRLHPLCALILRMDWSNRMNS